MYTFRANQRRSPCVDPAPGRGDINIRRNPKGPIWVGENSRRLGIPFYGRKLPRFKRNLKSGDELHEGRFPDIGNEQLLMFLTANLLLLLNKKKIYKKIIVILKNLK